MPACPARPLVAAVLMALCSAAARAEECPPLRGLCARLAERPPLLSSGEDGVIANPARITGVWAALEAARLTGRDDERLSRVVAPLFERLKAAQARRAEAALRGPKREAYVARLRALRLVVDDRERCKRRESPFAAGAGARENLVTICPWMTRAAPSTLVWVLGHEIGHHADPCWDEYEDMDDEAAPIVGALALIDPRRARCKGGVDQELYADAVGAELTEAVMPRAGINLPADVDLRAAALLQHFYVHGCEEGGERLDAFLARPRLRTLLRCGR